ncbi:MAG: acetyl-CoA acetyltransferase [Betaproteobacteria bacterium RIFCSPLOWO2_02_FULL_65_24]|nr:MAG: acetyl-CoA acetyltransferase [Betaproteobacteria bacterium RIFCSPLOWO2_02_FULL_65_24]OGA57504.1 MAG: acetyl-CoA acetyltransferase [Betaproteobacteria bacterium RIFCSPLOWO2_12_FULL_65_14]
MNSKPSGLAATYDDTWLLDGVRTPFAEFNGVLGGVSPTDMGIKVARELFRRTGIGPADVGAVIAGCMAQASFDAYVLPRHIGLYSGVSREVPAQLIQRVCGTGFELIKQAADLIALRQIELGLCVGTESMSRNPIAAYTHRGGFRLGAQVEFKDFLWESLLDPAPNTTMGGTAENLAKQYRLERSEVDAFAADSFARALAAQQDGFLSGEIVPVVTEEFALENYKPRGIRLASSKLKEFATDDHVRPSPIEQLAKIRPAFGGVQTGGNSSGIVDGAAGTLVASGRYVRDTKTNPLARLVAAAVVGVAPEVMGIGPAPAIRMVLERAGIKLSDVDRFEINEAFGAQCLAVERELGLDHAKLNVNGGAIAIGHPLAATGVRLTVTVARELVRRKLRYGVSSACIGGGQGIALLVENTSAA